jgi:hypothetical protein
LAQGEIGGFADGEGGVGDVGGAHEHAPGLILRDDLEDGLGGGLGMVGAGRLDVADCEGVGGDGQGEGDFLDSRGLTRKFDDTRSGRSSGWFACGRVLSGCRGRLPGGRRALGDFHWL